MNSNLENIEEDINGLNSNLENIEEDINGLNSNLNNIEESVSGLNGNIIKEGVTYTCDFYAGLTDAGVIRTNSICLPLNISNKSVTITKVELANYGEVANDFGVIKWDFGFSIWTQNSNLIAGCANKVLIVSFKIS